MLKLKTTLATVIGISLGLTTVAIAANPDHVSQLLNGGRTCQGCDLIEADLSNITGRTVKGSQLRQSRLMNANLSNSNFEGSYFTCADLSNANLQGGNFRWSNFVDAKLQGVDLRGADLRNTDLTGADFTGAIVDNQIKLNGAKMPDGATIYQGDPETPDEMREPVDLNTLDFQRAREEREQRRYCESTNNQ
ncbi:pentapeptide repeat-containing protein [Roseofilum capinflatum]|uniref:Pentapeptide repeat-containing protein n=1 Tax=Roseofilum capinflatum BLCC-M114 TaxID=3022440 RepID=A0ABT7B407_9CYAN|nr:pentapeptide repeat-containing protein [Roseofilum capinflatum]MDJ1173910.1 pentapeptide repeat-containing protein [Roseofilum capinflatum BLCC-M114]